MKITPQMLRDKNVCPEDLDVFEKEWPDGVEITEASIHRMLALRLDIDWGLESFLTASAWEAYGKAIASAWEAYEKAIASAWEAYEKAIAPAREAYKKAIAPARKAYKKAKASAIIKAIQLQEQNTPTA